MIAAVALDLGTTTIKAGLLSQDGMLSGVVAQSAPAIAVAGGRYESDAAACAMNFAFSSCVARGIIAGGTIRRPARR